MGDARLPSLSLSLSLSLSRFVVTVVVAVELDFWEESQPGDAPPLRYLSNPGTGPGYLIVSSYTEENPVGTPAIGMNWSIGGET